MEEAEEGWGPAGLAGFGRPCTSQKAPRPPGRATEEERQRERPRQEQNRAFLVLGIADASRGDSRGSALVNKASRVSPVSGHCVTWPPLLAHPPTERPAEGEAGGEGQGERAPHWPLARGRPSGPRRGSRASPCACFCAGTIAVGLRSRLLIKLHAAWRRGAGTSAPAPPRPQPRSPGIA